MLYRFLQANPGVRLVIPLILGIILGTHFSVSAFSLLIVLCILFGLYIYVAKRLAFSVFPGIALFFFFTILGIFIVQYKQEIYHFPKRLGTHYVKAIVRGEAKMTQRSISVPVEVVQVKEGQKTSLTNFKSIVYFPKDTLPLLWNYGDTIIGKLSFSFLKNNTNPYAFSYAKLLRNQQIYCSARGELDKIHWSEAIEFSLLRQSKEMQKKLSSILDLYIPNEKARGFLQAMTLGNKRNLDSEVREDFTAVGVIHILAVSGLHVGILFLIINLLFRPLKSTQKGRIFLVGIGILAIWLFAFISGLSVSILRAAIMFSILQLNVLSLRPYRIYNAIAISAFIVLLINPFYLYEVGFQLSYCALLGIVTFVPLWQKKVQISNKWGNKIWQLILVSMAAQVGVVPLVLYYFHQQPTYFLLGNIVVLLAAPFLLGGSLLVLVCSVLPSLAHLLGFVVSKTTEICLLMVENIAALPGTKLVDYQLDIYQVVLTYSLVIFTLFYSLKRRTGYFALSLCCVFVLIGYTSIRYFQESRQEILVIHQVNNRSCYSILKGRSVLLSSDEDLTDDVLNFTIIPLWNAKHSNKKVIKLIGDKFEGLNIPYKNGHILVQGKHIVFYEESSLLLEKAFDIDILVLSNISDWERALENYNPKLIILDSSFSKRKSQKLTTKLSALGFSIYNVRTDGAFVLD